MAKIVKSKISFPYKIYKNTYYPIITLGVCGPKGWVNVAAYVDSGALTTIFSKDEAVALGLNYKRTKPKHVIIGDGSSMPVYYHKILVRIGDVRFHAHIGFSEKLVAGFALLGRRDIFSRFDVTFSDAARTITFKPR